MKYLKRFNEMKVLDKNYRCKICGEKLYRTDAGSLNITLQCSSDAAKFWNFDRGTKEQRDSHQHFVDSTVHVDHDLYDELEKEPHINESSQLTPKEILEDFTIYLVDDGLHVEIDEFCKTFFNKFALRIIDLDKVFCKNYPKDDMDWLHGKPIINDFIEEINDAWGLVRDVDYKLYGGGLAVSFVFEESGLKKLKL